MIAATYAQNAALDALCEQHGALHITMTGTVFGPMMLIDCEDGQRFRLNADGVTVWTGAGINTTRKDQR